MLKLENLLLESTLWREAWGVGWTASYCRNQTCDSWIHSTISTGAGNKDRVMEKSLWRTLISWHGPLCYIQKTHKVFENVISAETLPDWTEKDRQTEAVDLQMEKNFTQEWAVPQVSLYLT